MSLDTRCRFDGRTLNGHRRLRAGAQLGSRDSAHQDWPLASLLGARPFNLGTCRALALVPLVASGTYPTKT